MENKEIYESPFIEMIIVSSCDIMTQSKEPEYDDDENMGDWDPQGW